MVTLALSRSPVRSFKRPAPFRDAKLIVIATEGSVTEPHYFSMFDNPDGIFFNRKVRRIDVLPTEKDGLSAPNHVLNRLISYINENDIGDDDQTWLAIDVDRYEAQGILGEVVAAARRRKIRLAVSNPCFEVWLLCHFLDSLPIKEELKEVFKRCLGNVKQEYELAPYIESVHKAIEMAQKHDKWSRMLYPKGVGSHVYKLIREIIPAQRSKQ